MSWYQVRLLPPQELREAVINRLFELGAQGVDESSRAGEISGYFDEATRASVTRELASYLDSLSELFPKSPKISASFAEVAERNWAEVHKEHYQAQKLSRDFFLKPVWDDQTVVPGDMIPILMEPGQAFGTGLHPSTRLCLAILERAVDAVPKRSQLQVLDIGTGTGILAIAASKLGVKRVVATDIDPIAVTTARENFALNGCSEIAVSDSPVSAFGEGEFSLVIANILLETHRSLIDEYRRVVATGGMLVLSGLLGSQRAEIDDIVLKSGFVLETRESLQEWLAVAYFRRDD